MLWVRGARAELCWELPLCPESRWRRSTTYLKHYWRACCPTTRNLKTWLARMGCCNKTTHQAAGKWIALGFVLFIVAPFSQVIEPPQFHGNSIRNVAHWFSMGRLFRNAVFEEPFSHQATSCVRLCFDWSNYGMPSVHAEKCDCQLLNHHPLQVLSCVHFFWVHLQVPTKHLENERVAYAQCYGNCAERAKYR